MFTSIELMSRLVSKKVNLIVNQVNYGLIKEEHFTINLCKNSQKIMIFQRTPKMMKTSQ